MDIRLRKRNSHSFLNDVELPIQAMHQTSMEVGFAERLYLQRNTLYFRLAHRFGLGWMGAQEEKAFADAPKALYRMWLLDVDFVHPFEFSHWPATFTTSFHGQYTMMGAAVGLRGSIDTVSYDVFAGAMPIRKPEGFHTSDVTSGFSLGVKF